MRFKRVPAALAGGEGMLESDFAGYQPVSGTAPNGRRTTANPLNRGEYLNAPQALMTCEWWIDAVT